MDGKMGNLLYWIAVNNTVYLIDLITNCIKRHRMKESCLYIVIWLNTF